MKRFSKYALYETAAPILGFLASMVILAIIVLIVGESPAKAADAIWKMTFSKSSRAATILSTSIPLYIAGIAVAFAFRASIFNIGVDTAGAISVGKTNVTLEKLDAMLAAALKRNTNSPVFVTADKEALHGSVNKVLARVRSAGVQRVAFAVAAAKQKP